MTKYAGKIEAKEVQEQWKKWGFKFQIGGLLWNCFDRNAYANFKINDVVEYETVKDGKFENLIPETMKLINAPETMPGGSAGSIPAVQERIHKNINENMGIIWKREDGEEMITMRLGDIFKNMNSNTTKVIDESKDSLEISTPSKGGAIKVYGDFNNMAEFSQKILKAKQIRDEANKLFNPENF